MKASFLISILAFITACALSMVLAYGVDSVKDSQKKLEERVSSAENQINNIQYSTLFFKCNGGQIRNYATQLEFETGKCKSLWINLP